MTSEIFIERLRRISKQNQILKSLQSQINAIKSEMERVAEKGLMELNLHYCGEDIYEFNLSPYNVSIVIGFFESEGFSVTRRVHAPVFDGKCVAYTLSW